jgi:thymidylate kinase
MRLITFSGLDGSGKSTQIEAVVSMVSASGLRVRRLAFWDDGVVLKAMREEFVHKVYGSEAGVGTPENPVIRRDKNMRGWHLALGRPCLYLLDAWHLRSVVACERRSGCDVLIMDRYIYDEPANLPWESWVTQALVRCTVRLAPAPDLAFLLDADPDAAHLRKPEYPVSFMRECRKWYHRLAALLGTMTVIPPLSRQEAGSAIRRALCHRFPDLTTDFRLAHGQRIATDEPRQSPADFRRSE